MPAAESMAVCRGLPPDGAGSDVALEVRVLDGDLEQRHEQLAANQAWLEGALCAHDLIIWTQLLLFDGEHAVCEPRRNGRCGSLGTRESS